MQIKQSWRKIHADFQTFFYMLVNIIQNVSKVIITNATLLINLAFKNVNLLLPSFKLEIKLLD
jgi:hypothetical protein